MKKVIKKSHRFQELEEDCKIVPRQNFSTCADRSIQKTWRTEDTDKRQPKGRTLERHRPSPERTYTKELKENA